MIMRPQDWNDLLRLLAMMVMSSGKPVSEEIKIFQKNALALRDNICPQQKFTEGMAHDWLEHRRSEIERSMNSVYFDDALKKALGNLQRMPRKRAILLNMIKMTISCDDRTRDEHRIITRVADIWDISKDRQDRAFA